jgi:hypothetical protein
VGGVLLVAGLGYLGLQRRESTAARLPYERQQYLFSKAERSFYEVLTRIVGSDMQVFAKVRIADLVRVRPGTENFHSYLNRITSKHVDYVLCDRRSLSPMLVVELDDSTHDRSDRSQRDHLVDLIFESAGLPILHVRARASYNTAEVAEQIRAALFTRPG